MATIAWLTRCAAQPCRSSRTSPKATCRATLGDYIRFCLIARGSLGEFGSQLQDSERWGLLADDELSGLLDLYSEVSLLLERLIASLLRKQKSVEWDRSFGVHERPVAYGELEADVLREWPSLELDDGNGPPYE
ncbi:MAG: four helix bundle protein [Anaerolineae bacterium]